MNCRGIIEEWLKENGYDGVCNPELECGCGLDDFCPCEELSNMEKCQPAYYDAKRKGWFTDKPKEKP